MTIKEMVRVLRTRSRMTQAQFARALGVTRETVAHYEGGGMRPSLERLEMMAKLSGLSINDLLNVPSADQSAEKEQQNTEARANLEICLNSPQRPLVISFLETFSGRKSHRKGR